MRRTWRRGFRNLHASCAGLDVHKETVVPFARIADEGVEHHIGDVERAPSNLAMGRRYAEFRIMQSWSSPPRTFRRPRSRRMPTPDAPYERA